MLYLNKYVTESDAILDEIEPIQSVVFKYTRGIPNAQQSVPLNLYRVLYLNLWIALTIRFLD